MKSQKLQKNRKFGKMQKKTFANFRRTSSLIIPNWGGLRLRAMLATEWSDLKKQYKTLQKQNMRKLKQSLKVSEISSIFQQFATIACFQFLHVFQKFPTIPVFPAIVCFQEFPVSNFACFPTISNNSSFSNTCMFSSNFQQLNFFQQITSIIQ